MEVSALTHKGMPGLSGPSPLLRLQSDERLIALTRRGQHAAFEVLFSRYQSRLLAFCRHMLGSREDAEDVLQEVFTAAFNAMLADEREINVRPWLYRIARNRSLNHLRRASAIGVDSMDVHYADHGLSTGERVLKRESFRQLLGDVNALPETQRTALLLREIDALSYEQIADAMETTVPSVKSLLVRARISLAEAAEARQLSCDEVRMELGEMAEGLTKLSAPARRHVRSCERCRFFKKQLKDQQPGSCPDLPGRRAVPGEEVPVRQARLDRVRRQRACRRRLGRDRWRDRNRDRGGRGRRQRRWRPHRRRGRDRDQGRCRARRSGDRDRRSGRGRSLEQARTTTITPPPAPIRRPPRRRRSEPVVVRERIQPTSIAPVRRASVAPAVHAEAQAPPKPVLAKTAVQPPSIGDPGRSDHDRSRQTPGDDRPGQNPRDDPGDAPAERRPAGRTPDSPSRPRRR